MTLLFGFTFLLWGFDPAEEDVEELKIIIKTSLAKIYYS